MASYDRHLPTAIEGAFDRETGSPISASHLRCYRETLAQYHLQPEAKFLNGDYVDRGTTERRHVRLTGIELIGKEANRWEEQEHLGLFADAEITYGAVESVTAEITRRIALLKPDFSHREQAYRLGMSRSRFSRSCGRRADQAAASRS